MDAIIGRGVRYCGMEIYENYSLKGLSTFGIDAKARRIMFLRGSTLDEPFRFMYDVDELLKSDFRQGLYMVIGEGSNIVFTKDYEGTLIKIGEAVFHGGGLGENGARGKECGGRGGRLPQKFLHWNRKELTGNTR